MFMMFNKISSPVIVMILLAASTHSEIYSSSDSGASQRSPYESLLDSPKQSALKQLNLDARPNCAKSTILSYCLEDSSYPSDDIQKEINRNYGEFYKMYAEVANQSASSLVDGVTDKEESTYDYTFYYGNKRNSPSNNADYQFRQEYYKGGGYICPAFIEYTPVYQATNARGEWQYVVNVKPWLQTVRLEQCFYPLARCSYVSKAINSQCVQKYSFQRLVAYEPQDRGGRGLFTDVFRLPTACSCHIRPTPGRLRGRASNALQVDASQSMGTFAQSPTDGQLPQDLASLPQPSLSNGYAWPVAAVNTDVASADQSETSPLVEKRRIRPYGLSPSEVAAGEESDQPDFVPPSTNDAPYQGNYAGPPPNFNTGNGGHPGMMNNGFGGPAAGPLYHGDGSRVSPSYMNMPPGDGNRYPGGNGGPPGPPPQGPWRPQQQNYGPPNGPPGPPENMRGPPPPVPPNYGPPPDQQGNSGMGYIDWNSRNRQNAAMGMSSSRSGTYDGAGMLPAY